MESLALESPEGFEGSSCMPKRGSLPTEGAVPFAWELVSGSGTLLLEKEIPDNGSLEELVVVGVWPVSRSTVG